MSREYVGLLFKVSLLPIIISFLLARVIATFKRLKSLKKPILDPRDELVAPALKSDILTIDNLNVGMKLSGVVRNVVDFGAFIDIGLKNDGLVHISEISNEFIKHPSEVLKVGDIIDCYVKDIDKEKGRVGLTLKE